MNTSLIEEVKSTVKNWWVSLVLGIMFVVVALWLMFQPGDGYAALVVVFSICMFISGILEVVFAAINREILPGWGWYLACGIIDVILGLVLICFPFVTAMVIPFILAFWIMFRGFTAVGYAMDLNRFGVKGWGWYLVFGVLAIICSLSIIWQPTAGALASVYIVAFAFLFMGFFRIMLAFDLRSLYKNSKELKEKLNTLAGNRNE